MSIFQKIFSKKQDLKTKLFFLCKVAGGWDMKIFITNGTWWESKHLDKIKKERWGSFHSYGDYYTTLNYADEIVKGESVQFLLIK